jgi:hypothetical protein
MHVTAPTIAPDGRKFHRARERRRRRLISRWQVRASAQICVCGARECQVAKIYRVICQTVGGVISLVLPRINKDSKWVWQTLGDAQLRNQTNSAAAADAGFQLALSALAGSRMAAAASVLDAHEGAHRPVLAPEKSEWHASNMRQDAFLSRSDTDYCMRLLAVVLHHAALKPLRTASTAEHTPTSVNICT